MTFLRFHDTVNFSEKHLIGPSGFSKVQNVEYNKSKMQISTKRMSVCNIIIKF